MRNHKRREYSGFSDFGKCRARVGEVSGGVGRACETPDSRAKIRCGTPLTLRSRTPFTVGRLAGSPMPPANALIPEIQDAVRQAPPRRRGELANRFADLFVASAPRLTPELVALFDQLLLGI